MTAPVEYIWLHDSDAIILDHVLLSNVVRLHFQLKVHFVCVCVCVCLFHATGRNFGPTDFNFEGRLLRLPEICCIVFGAAAA